MFRSEFDQSGRDPQGVVGCFRSGLLGGMRKARLQPDQWEKGAAGEQRTAVYGHVMASFHKAAPRCISLSHANDGFD